MATYYYKCETCEETANIIVPINEGSTAPDCPTCKVEMARVFSAPGITFKGSGWGSDR
jgi:putative FmdB family regulatory protein